MKTTSATALILLSVFTACSPKEETKSPKPAANIEGVWEMRSLYSYGPDGDSTAVPLDSMRQIKIYSGGYVMWARRVPADSSQWYGWGKYTTESDTLKEWIEYGSHAFSEYIIPDVPFIHTLSVAGDTYVQIAYDSTGKKRVAEHYMLISEHNDQPVDDVYPSLQGVWEMTKLENEVNGSMQTLDRTGYRQIKMYHDGYVMWSQQVPRDSVEWFGFGKYSSNGGLLTEWMEFGSHSFMPYIGQEPFIMGLTFSKDGYIQTSMDNEGNEDSREYYKKLAGPVTNQDSTTQVTASIKR